jgi:hypothetical protein
MHAAAYPAFLSSRKITALRPFDHYRLSIGQNSKEKTEAPGKSENEVSDGQEEKGGKCGWDRQDVSV